MIEELFRKAQNIGVFDEVFSVFEVAELFKAIRDGKIKKITFRQPDEMSFDIRCVTLCKDCVFRNTDSCITKHPLMDDFYCWQGTEKDGDET